MKKIFICGAGTLGGNLAENLARQKCYELKVVDKDRVEEKNLKNQPYSFYDIGQPKVKALSAYLFRAVKAEMQGIFTELINENIDKFCDQTDLLVDAFDNSRSRRIVKEFAEKKKIPCLHIGLSDDGYGEVIWNEFYKVPPDTGDEPCEAPRNRNISIMLIAIASEVISSYFTSKVRRNYSLTLKDLKIEFLF